MGNNSINFGLFLNAEYNYYTFVSPSNNSAIYGKETNLRTSFSIANYNDLTGNYYLRLDPLIQKSNIKFSNFRIFESVTQHPCEKEVYNGEMYGTLPQPTKEVYTFAGWYTQANGGTQIKDISIVSLTENKILYAH